MRHPFDVRIKIDINQHLLRLQEWQMLKDYLTVSIA
nr:MAG TPA: hypothetical protein [Bacteriophage sp.]